MGMGATVIARILSLHAGKWLAYLEEMASFLENLFLSALTCPILGEKCCSSYLADAWDLCILICVRFLQSTGLVMKWKYNFPFFVYQPQVATWRGVSAVFLPLFYGCLNIFSCCKGRVFTGNCVKVLPTMTVPEHAPSTTRNIPVLLSRSTVTFTCNEKNRGRLYGSRLRSLRLWSCSSIRELQARKISTFKKHL